MNAKQHYTQEVINKVNEFGYVLSTVRPDQVMAYSYDKDNEFNIYRRENGMVETNAGLRSRRSIEEAKETVKAYENAIALAEYIQSIDLDKMLEVSSNRIVER